MQDSLLFRALPAFTGCLVFMPACGSNNNSNDDDASSSSSGDPTTTTTTMSTTMSEEESGPQDTSSESSSPESSSDDGPTGCPEDALCAALPDGWFGPMIFARDTGKAELPECPEEDFPFEGPSLFEGFAQPGPAECECECTPPAMQNCSASIRSGPNQYNCYGLYQNVSEVCTNFSLDNPTRFRLYGGYNPPPCMADTTETIPPIAWEATIRTCEIAEDPMSCFGGNVCIPAPVAGFEEKWCLYQQGDVGCPAGVFNTKHKFYTGADDTRGCSDCTCSSSGNACQTGELMLFSEPDCIGEPFTALAANDSCQDVTSMSMAVSYGDGASSCPVASAPHAEGSAEAAGVFTFCCTG